MGEGRCTGRESDHKNDDTTRGKFIVKIEKDSFFDGELVHSLLDRKMIQSLEEKYGNHERREIKSLITDLGL